jgi:hypothetical protein
MFTSKFNLVYEDIKKSLLEKSRKDLYIKSLKSKNPDTSKDISDDKSWDMFRLIEHTDEPITFEDIEPFLQIPANKMIHKMIQEAIIKQRFKDGSFTDEEKTKILDELSKHTGKSDIGFLIATSRYASSKALANVFNNIEKLGSYDFRIYSGLVSNKNTPKHIVDYINTNYKKYLPML